jgi:4-amino-4-deoxychorismate lyase
MFPLFESIKVVDGQMVNLPWHQQRVDRSVKAMGITDQSPELASSLVVPEGYRIGVVKCRVSYGEGLGPVVYSHYARKTIRSLQQVDCDRFDYSLKYQNRSRLDQLYQKRGVCDEVLITIDGMVTDTSYSNVVLFDGNNWYTPQQPLLEGTQRAKLLAAGEIHPAKIRISEVGDFEKLVLINAMLEFDPNHFLSVSDIKLWYTKKCL